MNSILFGGLLLASQIGLADDDFSKEVVKSTPLTSSIHILEGAGGNITALIGSDGVFLVDDDFAQMADKLLVKLKELKGTSPRFIVNTHFHYDHTGGNEVFGPTATIIAATAVRDRLMKEQTLWKKQHPPVPPQALPTLTFERTLTVDMNGEEIRILHLPHGHTDGDTVVFFTQGKVASLGDLYFSGMYPIFHLEHDGSLDGYIKNIETVLKQLPEDCKIVSGHGPLSTKADLAKYHQMIVSSFATVRKGTKAGRTLEQIQKAGLDPQWEPFSHGYVTTDRWIAMIYAAIRK
jgi:glyoxylase-like metal-dependent hydrolase (beta-lactamase superfamily II)